jgi:hypothetical protein
MLSLKVKTPGCESDEQLSSQQGINLKSVCRSLLKIVARLEENQYTEDKLRQNEVMEHSNLANPASGTNTSQG